MTTNEKLLQLRQLMKARHLDAYYVNTADPHQSEYISAYFRERAWLTGFTGSAGEALVTPDHALLWADGRYFIQAAKQIEGSEFRLMKMDTEGVPTLLNWLKENMPEGSRVGMSDNTVSQAFYERASAALEKKKITLVADTSLIDEIWQDRPALPQGEIFVHELRFTGRTAAEKVQQVRLQMQEDGVEAAVFAGLDDIAWLYNFRGSDVSSNPVALDFALITKDKAILYIDENKVTEAVRAHLTENHIEVRDYHAVSADLAALKVKSIALNKQRISRKLFGALPESVEVLNRMDYPTCNKAALNEVELENQRRCYLRDCAVIARYLFWVKRECAKQKLNEWTAAQKLHEMRLEQDLFIEESFTTISAYGPNAAMMHYGPSPEDNAELKCKGLYLCDCGGQYYDGTTDVTRTIALGELTDEEKTDFTLTLKSHINLARAVFLEGMTGHYIDILARQPLWRHYMDYKCGTGHAVGYVLGVHEGPQRISKYPSTVALREGMIVTNEPGVYKEGKHGIRLENDYVVAFEAEAFGDRFLRLEVLSYVPLDRDAIKKELLSEEEIEWLNHYHAECLEKLMPGMTTEEEREDLKRACAAI